MTGGLGEVIFAGKAPVPRSRSIVSGEHELLNKGNELINYLRSGYHLK
jgi:hypothetical protein